MKIWLNLSLLIALLICPFLTSGQDRVHARFVQEFYEETDTLFSGVSREVPAEYSDESAIILAHIQKEVYEGSNGRLSSSMLLRIMIKIQDKSALDNLSTLDLDYGYGSGWGTSNNRLHTLRIIKGNDGSTVDVDLNGLDKNSVGEVAIPGLEVDDIMDYGLKVSDFTSDFCFNTVLTSLTAKYPTVYGLHRFYVKRGFFVNFKSLNGKHALVANEALSERVMKVYDLEYHNLKSTEAERWTPYYRNSDAVYYQICFYPISRAATSNQIWGSPYEVKSSATMEEIERAAKAKHDGSFFMTLNDLNTKQYKSWLSKNFGKEKPKGDALMQHTFNFLRYYVLVYDVINNQYKSDYEDRYITPAYFVKFMRTAAAQNDIPAELVITTNRYVSDFDQVLMSAEFQLALRYRNDAGEWQYIYPFYSFDSFGYSDERFEGQAGLASADGKTYTRIDAIPSSTHLENISSSWLEMEPDLENKLVQVTMISALSGSFKHDFSRGILSNTGFHTALEENLVAEGQQDVMLSTGKIQRGQMLSEGKVAGDIDEKRKLMHDRRKNNFDIEEYEEFEILTTGIVHSSDSLKMRERFTVRNAIDKVGPNFVLDLSKVTLDQASFTDEEVSERKREIMLDYAKTYLYTYHIKIPEGYTAAGFDKLNEQVENEYGRLELIAVLEGNQLEIRLTKSYKKPNAEVSDWPKFTEFLLPAMKLNEAKVVFKKIA